MHCFIFCYGHPAVWMSFPRGIQGASGRALYDRPGSPPPQFQLKLNKIPAGPQFYENFRVKRTSSLRWLELLPLPNAP
ncbi:predicted protein [Uncinocarpus reesii 1704]|uniref:Uncharacterized protein n=1 Tax=Uncinocarpus reesii (strain UAMH 1704) TaxID=336963 RepID=C4JLV0_UNCRE|nr:uncharacterized protein UREG_03808 [Uncinocarpus reesii 1704]EEP78962.1 predicted protein [Uncinocarpus reesii 1704]